MNFINQVLATIQGEGKFIGTPTLLVRVQGCNARCKFCDTKEALRYPEINESEIDVSRLVQDIYGKFGAFKLINLLITGGEPTIYFKYNFFAKFIEELFDKFDFRSMEIETNGAGCIFSDNIPFFENLFGLPLVFNISPKVEFKNEVDNDPMIVVNNINFLISNCISFTLKILNYPPILNKSKVILSQIKSRSFPIYIMPLTPYTKNNEIDYKGFRKNCMDTIKFCLKTGYLFSPRTHIWIFGEDKNEGNQAPIIGHK